MTTPITIGTTFYEATEGYTLTGYVQIIRQWEVAGPGWVCRLLRDDSVVTVNPAYRRTFSEDQIERMQAEFEESGWRMVEQA